MFRTPFGRLLLYPCVMAIGCVLLPFGSAQGDAQDKGSQVQQHFLAAQQDQQNGRLEEAAHEYETVLRLQPGIPEVYVNLGLVYYAQAKFESSAHALTAAAKLKPGMRGVSLWLGIDDVKLRRPEQAIPLLRDAIRQGPADKLAETWLGTALWDAGQMDAALLQLGKASARFPLDLDVLFARGEAYGKAATEQTAQLLEASSGTALSDLIYGAHYAEQSDWTKAEGHLNRAILRDPRLLDARLALADVLLRQAKLSDAQEQLQQALALEPRSAAALARSGELLLLTRHPSDGLARIAQGLEIDRPAALDALGLPLEDRFDQSGADAKLLSLSRQAAEALEADSSANPAREVALAALHELAGDQDAAQHAYRRIVPANPVTRPPASLILQAITDLHEHRYDQAEPELLRWLAAHPADRAARYDLILVRREISRAEVSRLLAVAPDSYHVHQLLGQIYASREEDDQALKEYLAVASAEPGLPGVHFWLGHLYWKHGDADHALAELGRELELTPGHPEADAELGAILVAQERAAEAIPHLESAVRSKPDLWPAYTQLGRAFAIEKDYARAEEALKRGLAHDADGSAHYQLGMVLRAEGKTAQAAQVFAQVRAIKTEKMAAPPTDDAMDSGAKQ